MHLTGNPFWEGFQEELDKEAGLRKKIVAGIAAAGLAGGSLGAGMAIQSARLTPKIKALRMQTMKESPLYEGLKRKYPTADPKSLRTAYGIERSMKETIDPLMERLGRLGKAIPKLR